MNKNNCRADQQLREKEWWGKMTIVARNIRYRLDFASATHLIIPCKPPRGQGVQGVVAPGNGINNNVKN